MQRGLNFLFISDFWGDRSNAVGRGKEYYNAILHAKFLSTWREKFVQAHLLHPSFIKMQSVLRRTNRKFKKSSKIYISSPYNLRLACFAHCFISISQEYWCRSHIGPSYYTDLPRYIYILCIFFFSKYVLSAIFVIPYFLSTRMSCWSKLWRIFSIRKNNKIFLKMYFQFTTT